MLLEAGELSQLPRPAGLDAHSSQIEYLISAKNKKFGLGLAVADHLGSMFKKGFDLSRWPTFLSIL